MQHKTQESSNNNSNHIFIVAHTHSHNSRGRNGLMVEAQYSTHREYGSHFNVQLGGNREAE